MATTPTTPATSTRKYAYAGPPFNFLGHMSESQYNKFQPWVNARVSKFPSIQQFYQIRAAQLRKTSGALEQFYKTLNDEVLTPTFVKTPWQPGMAGWFSYSYRNDQLPMVAMSNIKTYMKEQLLRQDEAVFQMNHIRNVIEKTEDKAQYANEATAGIQTLFTQITSYFNKPEYQAVLVKDLSDQYPPGSGQARYRVNQLDAPTQWELEQNVRHNTVNQTNQTGI